MGSDLREPTRTSHRSPKREVDAADPGSPPADSGRTVVATQRPGSAATMSAQAGPSPIPLELQTLGCNFLDTEPSFDLLATTASNQSFMLETEGNTHSLALTTPRRSPAPGSIMDTLPVGGLFSAPSGHDDAFAGLDTRASSLDMESGVAEPDHTNELSGQLLRGSSTSNNKTQTAAEAQDEPGASGATKARDRSVGMPPPPRGAAAAISRARFAQSPIRESKPGAVTSTAPKPPAGPDAVRVARSSAVSSTKSDASRSADEGTSHHGTRDKPLSVLDERLHKEFGTEAARWPWDDASGGASDARFAGAEGAVMHPNPLSEEPPTPPHVREPRLRTAPAFSGADHGDAPTDLLRTWSNPVFRSQDSKYMGTDMFDSIGELGSCSFSTTQPLVVTTSGGAACDASDANSPRAAKAETKGASAPLLLKRVKEGAPRVPEVVTDLMSRLENVEQQLTHQWSQEQKLRAQELAHLPVHAWLSLSRLATTISGAPGGEHGGSFNERSGQLSPHICAFPSLQSTHTRLPLGNRAVEDVLEGEESAVRVGQSLKQTVAKVKSECERMVVEMHAYMQRGGKAAATPVEDPEWNSPFDTTTAFSELGGLSGAITDNERSGPLGTSGALRQQEQQTSGLQPVAEAMLALSANIAEMDGQLDSHVLPFLKSVDVAQRRQAAGDDAAVALRKEMGDLRTQLGQMQTQLEAAKASEQSTAAEAAERVSTLKAQLVAAEQSGKQLRAQLSSAQAISAGSAAQQQRQENEGLRQEVQQLRMDLETLLSRGGRSVSRSGT